ncbi:MAG TPA: carbohydrate-binding family 9-like protein [Verrucomicrobiae bacterium]|nr:carbohydrate-binding family 9-like protein [Verrucomicrobiae bacterium]
MQNPEPIPATDAANWAGSKPRAANVPGRILLIQWCLLVTLAPIVCRADQWKFPCPDDGIAHYTAYHIHEPIHIDGRLDEKAWREAPRSPRFVDIISGEPGLYDTRAMVLWDDTNLYVAFRLQEPLLHARFTTNNSPIYYDNDAEVFIAGRDAYYEFEINGFNTTYEAFFIWDDAYERDGFSLAPEFQRSLLQPFNGVGFTTHPRGGRLGDFNWHFPGKKTAVLMGGTVNNDSDRDRGWSVELAFPWQGMKWLAAADHRSLPPRDGDIWRIDFSRFNTYKEAPPATDSGGWVWSRHGVWDSHIPECFPYIRFSTEDVSQAKSPLSTLQSLPKNPATRTPLAPLKSIPGSRTMQSG